MIHRRFELRMGLPGALAVREQAIQARQKRR
jgi:hypothetical protein